MLPDALYFASFGYAHRGHLCRVELMQIHSPTNSREPVGPPDPANLDTRTVDGTYNDLNQPSMGMAGSRFGRNMPIDRKFESGSTLLDPNPVHVGGICSFGIFCSAVPNANRSLADAIAIAVDPAGGANAVWTNDAGKKRQIEFACQDSGASAFSGQPNLDGCYGSG